MISVSNKQRTIKLNIPKIKQQLALILRTVNRADFEVNVQFVSDKIMAKFNQQYRDKSGPTDILSFPMEDEEEKILGDILIAPAYLKKDAVQRGITFDDRLRLLLIHGVLHLMGYDHITEADYKTMRAREITLEKKLKIAGL